MTAVTLDAAAQLLHAYIDADIPAFMWGDVGIGKSEVVTQIAQDMGADLVDIRLSMFDPVDLRGLPTTSNGETHWARPAIWPTREDKPVFLFFDEMDRASASVQSAALQIVLDRKIGEHTLPANVRIVAAGNGKTDRVGTNRTSAAGNNRFAHIEVEPEVDAWKSWAYKVNLHPMVIAFIAFRPHLLHRCLNTQGQQDRDAKAFPTPRAWQKVAEFADMPDNIRPALVEGLIGEGAAAEFNGFVKTFRQLPSLDGVIADPTGAPVPSDPGAKFAIAVGLATRADPSTFKNICTYAKRLGDDVAVMLAAEATRKDPGLYHTEAYTTHFRENQGMVA